MKWSNYIQSSIPHHIEGALMVNSTMRLPALAAYPGVSRETLSRLHS
ncbi:hypothetical protein [Sinomicrobium sp. M5D2P9]